LDYGQASGEGGKQQLTRKQPGSTETTVNNVSISLWAGSANTTVQNLAAWPLEKYENVNYTLIYKNKANRSTINH